MSYTNKTTHYEIPLPTSTDLVNGLDWNDSSEAIDTALYNASQAATQVAGDITTIKATIALLEAADVTFQSDLNAVTGRVTTLEQNQGTIAEDVQDVADMITAYEEATATASRAYEEGDPFRYNGVLYIATTDIAQGATIVPNVNCRATNVMEEMLSGGGGEVVDVTARAGVANNSAKIGTLANLDTTVKTDLVSAINEVLSQIGGGGMFADFSNVLHRFSSDSLSYTATEDGMLFAHLNARATPCELSINSNLVTACGHSSATEPAEVNMVIPFKQGDVISVTSLGSEGRLVAFGLV